VFRNIRATGSNGIFFDYPVRYVRAYDEGYMCVSNLVFEGYSGSLRGSAVQIVVEDGVKIRGVRDVVFRDFDVKSARPLRFVGNADSPLENLRFENVTVNGERRPDGPVAPEVRPSRPLRRAESWSWETMSESGFRIRDPFVLVDGGHYYLYESKPWSGGRGVEVRRSADLVTWTAKEPAMVLPDSVRPTAIWAPEVHRFGGKFWMFATITEEKGVRPMAAMGEGVEEKNLVPRGTWIFSSDRPTGPFMPVKLGPVPPAELQTLDGTLYVEDGRPYMVYCHEWCQMGNGTIEYAPLASDFASFLEPPKKLLDARSAMDGAGKVTDGPFFHRSEKSGRLYLVWSNSVAGHGYCVLVRSSESGKIAGPWTKDEILFGKDGGHGMVFKGVDGKLRITFHQPNKSPDERMRIFELDDDGERLSVR
jgi:GH43 family beta-xylosidase